MTKNPDSLPRIDYQILKNHLVVHGEPLRITQQWASVIAQCQSAQLNADQRAALALSTVDYVTSYELPFRLLLLRAPQAVDAIRKEMKIYSRRVDINGGGTGVVYSRKSDIVTYDDFHYTHQTEVIREDASGQTQKDYVQFSAMDISARAKLVLALNSGLLVTAIDALLFFGIQRVAANIARLRSEGMAINLLHASAFDSQTQTTRDIPAYRLANPTQSLKFPSVY